MTTVAIVLNSEVIAKALSICAIGLVDAASASPDDAEVVVSDDATVLAKALASGKRAAQFVYRPGTPLLSGLKKTYKDRFGIFGVLSEWAGEQGDGDALALYAFIGKS